MSDEMARGNKSTLVITPMSSKLLLEPGEEYHGKIVIANPLDAEGALSYKVSVGPYNVVGTDYVADLTTRTERSQIVDWITIDEPLGILAPNTSKEIYYTIKVPENVAGGGQYAVITVGTDERDSSNMGGLNIKNIYEMASVVYARVNGEIRRGGEIIVNEIPGFVTTLPIQVSTKLRNDGNVHESAEIKVVVKNFLNGAQLYPEEGYDSTIEEVMMPETERLITRDITSVSPVGLYEVTQSVSYLGQMSYNTRLVVSCPVWFMTMIVVTLGIIIYGVGLMIKKHKKKKIII